MAWNDPQWGKKNDGPPDLDEIWRRFNEKLEWIVWRKTIAGHG
jgi:protease FtsH subunit HflK